jgi:YVTN family beta-propeller protein
MLFLKIFFTIAASAAVAAAQPYGYVSNEMGNNVSVVNLATNKVTKTISISGAGLTGLAIMPNGAYVYVAEENTNCVALISTSSHMWSAP